MKQLRPRFAVRRISGKRQIPLAELKTDSGNWVYSSHFHECLVAKSWNVDLDRWDNLSREAKAKMIATYNAENKIRAYEDKLMRRQSDLSRTKPKTK